MFPAEQLTLISCNLMNIWLLSALFLPSCCYATRDAQYECGPHGRFEYCIDGIPGCVIGCHCHPGYYFDTDSKICEPNIKLSQDYRRHYLSEPTRIQVPSNVPTITNDFSSTANPVDGKIDEITKDASDLGDWLYNQFFKTIENQVINNTDENQQILTRRSGGALIKKKPKRKSRKYLKRTGKKRKNKKNGLKKKLLRITEDDSLFDSSSTSSSDETSSSSNESNGETSSESEKDKDHGHKKILIYNKKPKPSLPSFIFLPNMDTPFYPPIGIPPPPALPMYPMVPVPPMGPMFPYLLGTTPHCDTYNSTTTNRVTTANSNIPSSTSTSPANVESTTIKHTTTETTTTRTQDTTTPQVQDSSVAEGNVVRSKHNDNPSKHSQNEKLSKGRPNHGSRIKLLQTIKQKLKRRNKVAPIDHFIATQDLDEPFLDSNYLQNSANFLKKQPENYEDDTPMEDVDFKYITELIHRANNTKRGLKLPTNDVFLGIPRTPTNRRNDYHNSDNKLQSNFAPTMADHRLIRRPQESDDSYYTNLGRQIASMIRRIDTQGPRQLDIEIERSKQSVTTSQPFFNENVYVSRSYWDRLIRSTEKKYYPLYFGEGGYFKDSNENLINVENKVKFAVGTILPLSLPELENIINELKYTHNQTKTSNVGLTRKVTPAKFGYKLFRKPINTPKRDEVKNNNMVNISKSPENEERNKNIHDKFYNDWLNNLIKTELSNGDNTRSKTHNPKTLAIPPKRRLFNDSALRIPLLNHLQFLKTIHNIPIKPTVKKMDLPFQVNPVRFNRKHLNHDSGNSNQYLYQKSMYPVYVLDNTRKLYQPSDKSVKPSYFHHELHHFDYFDN